MKEKYDVVIIGSGLGGLASGVILAKHGYSVCIVEKNRQAGGNLQTFARNKKIFDTGVHYIGGLEKGQNLHQIFKYLGIMDKLRIERMDMDAFDVVSMPDKPDYVQAQTYELFKEKLYGQFPKEKEGIDAYCAHMIAACDSFPLYRLIGEKENVFENKYVKTGARDLIASLTSDPDLQNLLAGNNFLYEGIGEATPFHVHALVVNSYIESSWRMVGGGSQIALQLIKQLRTHSGAIFKKREVTEILSEHGKVTGVELKSGERIFAKYVISNIHPARTVQLVRSKKITPAFRTRVTELGNTRSSFSMHLVLKDGQIPYFNRNYYDFYCDDVWKAHKHRPWPGIGMISTGPGSANMDYADNLTYMTYMHVDEMKMWKESFNTTLQPSERGKDYEAFKEAKMDLLLDRLERRFPDIRNTITDRYASGPLAYRDYIGSADGSMYGIRRDYRFPERSFIGPRTKLKNLFLTGQNLSHLHGILGVSIAAISTCSELLGLEELTDKIRNC